MRGLHISLRCVLAVTLVITALLPAGTAHAAETGNFALQVSPSPLVATLKPGVTTELELKIRNAGTASEKLKIEPRRFEFNSASGSVNLNDTAPADIAQWISFSQPTFTVKPGEWYTQKVRIALPKEAGFSYSFALIISRTANPSSTEGGRLLKGSVAVFTLINVDKPGATRELKTVSLKASRSFYEYLPAKLSVTIKNSGNSIVQPYGNIFVQRNGNDTSPITTLPVNETRSYILPDTTRTLTATWSDGFPVYKSSVNSEGKETQKLTWNFDRVSNFRIGRYTAKLVAVYNDGVRDVPIQGEVTFWVFPWRAFLLLLVTVTALWLLGRWRSKRRTEKAVKRALAASKREPLS